MPREEDHTSLWWLDGFPGSVEGAPWVQCLKTGYYGLAINTERVQIPHLGPIKPGVTIGSLPHADLSLTLDVDGKSYRCVAGGPWSRHGGPRLVESGRFFQRFDVTDLEFRAEDGKVLNTEARLEMAAWADQLSLILLARPGEMKIPPGESAIGKAGGGFGLNGANHLELAAEAIPDSPEFTLSFWTFLPPDYKATENTPWLVCKNRNEVVDGNIGINIGRNGVPTARLNLGGGRENAHQLSPASERSLKYSQWNHLALSYDGETLRLFINGRLEGEKKIGVARSPRPGAMAFGRRQDNSGTGYYFRGIVDEIRWYNRAVAASAILQGRAQDPVGSWSFRPDGLAADHLPREPWKVGEMQITLAQGEKQLAAKERINQNGDWGEVELVLDPMAFELEATSSPVVVSATEVDSGKERSVSYESTLGWHRINLDGIEPTLPSGVEGPSNDSLEKVSLALSNSSEREQMARLMFEKTGRGIRQKIGTPITGISAVLRDEDGDPTGIPVQLSKNWHVDPEAGAYAGQWFHGITQVRLPPNSSTKLELVIAYGHWGGVPAASHAQLSLIGWGSNQRWDQSALGSWGESICYEPDQAQGKCTITDVRPLMVTPMNGKEKWGWTNNVGGGDFFRLFDAEGQRVPHSGMQAFYHRQGPCLTEVSYRGRLAKGVTHSATVSLGRTDDLVRGTYRIRLDVKEPLDFSRLVLFQVGADTYNMTHESLFAFGNEEGLTQEWATTPGGNTYQTELREFSGRIPWVSMHQGNPSGKKEISGAWANRGIVIRSWNAKLGGKPASPWIAEHGVESRGGISSTLDLVPPPGVAKLQPGDFVDAIIEHLVLPQKAEDYYGPNRALQEALQKDANTWKMIHREAVGNDCKINVTSGRLRRVYPDVQVATDDDEARFTISGGLGFVPLTFANLSCPDGFVLRVNGKVVDQAIHGKDFWQTDFDSASRTWSQTYNVELPAGQTHKIELSREP